MDAAATAGPRILFATFQASSEIPTIGLRAAAARSVRLSGRHAHSHRNVRRQSFWFQRPRDLSEYLAHLVGFIMRRVCGAASAGFRVFCV